MNAATATTAMLTSAILLTSEPAPAAWLVVLAASWRPDAGRPGRDSTAVTASPFAAKADQTRPRIATNPTCPLIRATSAAAAVVKEGG